MVKTYTLLAAGLCGLAGFAHGADTLVSAGESVRGWKVDAKGRWHARVAPGTRSSHFFVNGQRRLRPCLPRQGWYMLGEKTAPEPGTGRQRFHAGEGRFPADWDWSGVEAFVVHAWNISRLPVAGYDPVTKTVTCAVTNETRRYMAFDEHRWYRLENVKAALGEPGDWYLDGRELIYVPMPGETPENAECVLAVKEHALVIEGQTNVVIRGRTFAYANWNMPAEGQRYPQAAANAPAMVLVRNSRNVRFEDCAFLHCGGYALEFGDGAVDCAAVNCEFADLGAGGVKIGTAWRGDHHPGTVIPYATGCTVEECLIEHGGRYEPSGCGVWIGNASHCRVVNNTIRDLYYTGVSSGWTWDRQKSPAHHNFIACNDISDIGQKRLMDMGGVYMLGEQEGSEIVGNTIRNVTVTRGSGNGIYFDQGSSFMRAVSNYVENCDSAGIFVQFNTASNRVVDNVFVNAGRAMVIHSKKWDRAAGVTFPTYLEGNRFWWDDPSTRLFYPVEPRECFLAAKDNFYTTPLSDLAESGARGFYRRDFAKPAPLCRAGRTLPRKFTVSLPEVPAVFPPCPKWSVGREREARFDNEFVTIVFDPKGRLRSIREKASGRELIAVPRPFVTAKLKDGSTLVPERMKVEEDSYLVFCLPGGGEVWYEVTPFRGGWTFEIVNRVDIRDLAQLTFGEVSPVCSREKGGLSNIVMDERSAVVLRAYSPEMEMSRVSQSELAVNDGSTYVYMKPGYGFFFRRFGLAAGPADRILGMLDGMSKAAGMDRNGCGGPRSLSSGANRASYLFGTWMDMNSADDWVRLLDKAGCQMFHLHAWWLHRGSYEVNPMCFPGGEREMKAFVDRLHAEGKKASTHSLSAVVQFADPHIRPEWFDDLVTDAEYTLAKPYRRGDTELFVNERPIDRHARVLTGSTNGNVLRLGDDLLQYSDFVQTPPYRFTGVRVAREPYLDASVYDATQALGAEAAAVLDSSTRPPQDLSRDGYGAGTRLSYLHHRYAEFVAKPGSRLAEELTDRLAAVYNGLGLDGIYFDGSEAMPTRYGIDWLRERTIAKLKPGNGGFVNSASCRNPFNWWNRSLVGTWDHPSFGPRAFNDRHIRVCAELGRADFLASDLGWWNTHTASDASRGYFPEELEYVGLKSAANDMEMSLQGPRPSDGPLSYAADMQLTVFGKWQRARYAKAFRPELNAAMKEPGREFSLVQDETGLWNLKEMRYDRHRVGSADFAKWSVESQRDTPVSLRVEALWNADTAAARTNTVKVIDASMLKELKLASAEGVKAKADGGRTIRLTARNDSAAKNASWVSLSRSFDERKLFSCGTVSTLMVKGDGSGATLNVQLRTSRIYGGGCSENLVKLDFTGWRRLVFLMRERDSDATSLFHWPYEEWNRMNNPQMTFMCPIGGQYVESASFYLNGIGPGGSVDVELGEWTSVPMTQGGLEKGAVVRVGGEDFSVPFALPGGDYAELQDGFWTHFAAVGQPLERLPAVRFPKFVRGVNPVEFRGSARAEITFVVAGDSVPAFVPFTAEQRKLMNVEYEPPFVFAPEKGLAGEAVVRVRPGERADLAFEILGPISNPVVAGRRIPVTLRDEMERVATYDGRTWQAIRITAGQCGPDNRTSPAGRQVIAEGGFDRPFETLGGGTTRLPLSADSSAGARITFFKRYR